MNLEQLQDKIDRIIAWRKKELSYLLENAETSKGFSQSVAIRTGYVLTYAHFEGAIKELATLYIQYVSSQKIELNKLTMNFMLISIKEHDLKLLSETTKIKSRAKVIEDILNLRKSKEIPYKKIINTKSNLKAEVFQNILNTINFEESKYELNYKFIDTILLNTRNNIAHGSVLERTCDIEQFKECCSKVHKLITDFSEDVYNYAVEKKYMSIVEKKSNCGEVSRVS